MSDAMAQGMIEMNAAKDKDNGTTVARTPDSTTPATFYEWAEDVLKPAMAG